MSDTEKKSGLNHFVHALGWSWAGLRESFQDEAAFRQEVGLLLCLSPIALWFGQSPLEIALLIGSVLLVLIIELLNTAIEAAIDHISLEHHPLAKKAKDAGSAAVMLSLLNVGLIWILILLPQIKALF